MWLLLKSFAVLIVAGEPGVTLGTQVAQQGGSGMWALVGAYAPTWLEVVVAVGVVSLGALAFMVLCRALLSGGKRTVPDAAAAAA